MGPPHPILDHVLREMQRRKVRAKGPWHLGATRPDIEPGDAHRIGAFVLRHSGGAEGLHPLATRVLDALEGRGIPPEDLRGVAPALSEALSRREPLRGLSVARELSSTLVTKNPGWLHAVERAAEIAASSIASEGLTAFARELDALLMRIELERILAGVGAEAPGEIVFRWSAGLSHSCDWWIVRDGDRYIAISRRGTIQTGTLDDAISTLPESAFAAATRALR
jgi:hypothetical protein